MAETNVPEVERIFSAAPFIAELGLRLEAIDAGECRTSLALARRHLQQDGFVHAGVQATVADHTAGAAAATLVAKGQYVLTAQFGISLLRAARGAELRCVARVLKPGRALIVVESEVHCLRDAGSTLVSKATVILAVVGTPIA
jgi:uncharacterized protein (TIGR00369 family)